MRSCLAAALVVAALPALATAQTETSPLLTPAGPNYAWPPDPSRATIALWPGTPPDAIADPQPEADTSLPASDRIAGRPLVRLGHITVPTLTVYQPAANPSGAAIIVFPGGAYSVLAIDLEGTEVCQWLNRAGIACFVLKYRVPDTGPLPKSKAALDDAQRAVGLLRQHAADLHIDPDRIGVLGFSAGAHLAAALSTHFDKRLYPAVDTADQLSCRPNFAAIIYPGYLALPPAGKQDFSPRGINAVPSNTYTPNPDIEPTASTPPTFIVQAEDDPVHVENATTYFLQLKQANVPAELHLYADGGHGYGLRPTSMPITHWPTLAEIWLHTIGILPASPTSAQP